MPDRSTSETLQAYFDSLLGSSDPVNQADTAPTPVIASSAPEPQHLEAEPADSAASQRDRHTAKVTVSAGFSRPKNRDNRLASALNNVAQTSSKVTRPLSESHEPKVAHKPKTPNGTGLPGYKTDDQDALREEQKVRLQKLLSQQTVASKLPEKQAHQVDLKRDIAQELDITEMPDIALPEPELPAGDADAAAADVTTFHSEAAQEVEWNDNGRPQWAQERFDVLLFDVAGLTLAVPLVALGQIVRFTPEELTPIFGQSDWFMGLLNSNVGRLRVVNTSLFVMPEKYDASFTKSAEYAISLDGVQWALAVNKVNQPISLDPAEIKWRSERSKRSWLAGTVKSHMCALLDIPQMANMLNQSDKTLGSRA